MYKLKALGNLVENLLQDLEVLLFNYNHIYFN